MKFAIKCLSYKEETSNSNAGPGGWIKTDFGYETWCQGMQNGYDSFESLNKAYKQKEIMWKDSITYKYIVDILND